MAAKKKTVEDKEIAHKLFLESDLRCTYLKRWTFIPWEWQWPRGDTDNAV